jgi:hypothetical protein
MGHDQFDGLLRHDGLKQRKGCAGRTPRLKTHPQHWIGARHASLAAEG